MLKNLFAPRKPVDEVLLADDQPVSVHGFVDIYLRSRNWSINPDNRRMVSDKLASYRGRPCVDQASIEAFLDKGWVAD